MIQDGRANVFIKYTCASIVACLLMQILTIPTLVLGKFMHGVVVTIVHIAVQKMIVESVPKHVMSWFVPMTPVF